MRVSVTTDANKVKLTYRTKQNKKRTAAVKIRNGEGAKTLARGSKRIYARAKATSELRSSPRTRVQPRRSIFGDLDQNGQVSCSDQAILQADWGTASARSDLNRDGRVGGLDLEILLERWTAISNYCEVPESRLVETALRLVNEVRVSGFTCVNEPGDPYYPPVPALEPHELVAQAAKNHARYMAENDYVGHEETASSAGFTGTWASDRLGHVGFSGFGIEDVAAGFTTPEAAVSGWLESPAGHCGAIMYPSAKYLGLGFHYRATAAYLGHYWVLLLAG